MSSLPAEVTVTESSSRDGLQSLGAFVPTDAKSGLMALECPAQMLQRALGEDGFGVFQEEHGQADVYRLTAVQAGK